MLQDGEEWASCRAQGLCRPASLGFLGRWQGAGAARRGRARQEGSARRGPRARGAWRGRAGPARRRYPRRGRSPRSPGWTMATGK